MKLLWGKFADYNKRDFSKKR